MKSKFVAIAVLTVALALPVAAADAALTADSVGAPGEVRTLSWWRAITTNADTFDRVS